MFFTANKCITASTKKIKGIVHPKIVTVQKARDPIASEKQSLYLTTPSSTQWRWDKLAVQVQTPKHSGGADIIGSAGAVNPAVQSLQPSGNTETRPGENSLRTWKTDTESKKPQE